MTILRNLAFYLIFYGGSLFYVLGSLAALALGRKALIFVAAGWSTWHRLCVTGLLGIRIRVEGELPGEGYLVALKHESFFEAIDLPNLLGRPAVIAKAELLRIPFWGQAARVYGLIAVERDQGAKALRAMISGARRLIAEGRPLAIFPEGTRVPHGREAPLQSGFAGLYKLLGLPVVPIAVDSGPLYHRRWKRRGTITFRIGETIPTGLPREEIEARVLAAINDLNTTPA
ncbi:1-acyl-sn-glycerol-3-phosphate acyltransferase [Novosphingobium sp. G106]|uniref:lysophospholipid acyltransferase family protein n=1 Tax=Novosphingobium sp. G106 TaxID=2849500 RepID=UPI001C2D1DA2|nr:lysophospholipid acyltransferase family protein [Novosphingobium sp. G106]MBV1690790.1 1-acyl-sn-glycerol-3-phosphate acyltransferase [Novosphingobium sp. G106]